jgi:hypothetical protein
LSEDAPERRDDAPKRKGAPRRKRDVPKREDRRAVGVAVEDRIKELGTTAVEIHRQTGLSETTIGSVIHGNGPLVKSTLALLSAVLKWRMDHLYNILHGRAHENVALESPLEESLAELARGLAGIDTMRKDVSALKNDVSELKSDVRGIKNDVHQIGGQIDLVIKAQHGSGDDAESK